MLPQIDRHDHFYIQHVPPELQPYLHKVVERKKKEDYLEAQSIASKFSDDEIAEYKRRFKEFDADASGGIDIHELSRLMASIEPDPAKRLSQEKLDELMDEVGTRELPRARASLSLLSPLGDEAERARPRRRSALAVPLARSTSTAAARSTSTSSSSSSTSGGATRTAASARCVRSRALAITRRARALSLGGVYIYM